MPKRRLSDQTGEAGEKTTDLLFTREFGWSYHQFGNKRAGIDGEVEIVEDGDELSGRLLGYAPSNHVSSATWARSIWSRSRSRAPASRQILPQTRPAQVRR